MIVCKENTTDKTRLEKDLLGNEAISANVYYGIQTHRACKNFDLSGVRLVDFPQLVLALAFVKKAAATTNMALDQIDTEKGNAICTACDEILKGNYHEYFVVDMIQGGGGYIHQYERK